MEEKKNTEKSDALNSAGADDFLKICEQFKLGKLPTESQHPSTLNLSRDSITDV